MSFDLISNAPLKLRNLKCSTIFSQNKEKIHLQLKEKLAVQYNKNGKEKITAQEANIKAPQDQHRLLFLWFSFSIFHLEVTLYIYMYTSIPKQDKDKKKNRNQTKFNSTVSIDRSIGSPSIIDKERKIEDYDNRPLSLRNKVKNKTKKQKNLTRDRRTTARQTSFASCVFGFNKEKKMKCLFRI